MNLYMYTYIYKCVLFRKPSWKRFWSRTTSPTTNLCAYNISLCIRACKKHSYRNTYIYIHIYTYRYKCLFWIQTYNRWSHRATCSTTSSRRYNSSLHIHTYKTKNQQYMYTHIQIYTHVYICGFRYGLEIHYRNTTTHIQEYIRNDIWICIHFIAELKRIRIVHIQEYHNTHTGIHVYRYMNMHTCHYRFETHSHRRLFPRRRPRVQRHTPRCDRNGPYYSQDRVLPGTVRFFSFFLSWENKYLEPCIHISITYVHICHIRALICIHNAYTHTHTHTHTTYMLIYTMLIYTRCTYTAFWKHCFLKTRTRTRRGLRFFWTWFVNTPTHTHILIHTHTLKHIHTRTHTHTYAHTHTHTHTQTLQVVEHDVAKGWKGRNWRVSTICPPRISNNNIQLLRFSKGPS